MAYKDPKKSINRRQVLIGSGVAAGISQLSATASAATGPVIETTNGKLRGIDEPGVQIFKGIRYAETTGGANRFMPPVPVKPWSGIVDAATFGASCPQIPGSQAPLDVWYTAVQPISEDCLFLNVFTPKARHGDHRPVMVWFHGGAWMSCAGTAPGFDGTNLARIGDVVVVTVNHRLNLFGYIKLQGDSRFADSGNTGTLDMVAALKWVQENVAAFGGDPKNVTIFGQSGGAAKVATLMAFPAARGLFQKAIMESFSGGTHLRTPGDADRIAQKVAAAVGLQSADGVAMQGVPMQHLVASMKVVPDAFYPVLDGKNFLHDPYDPSLPATAADIPLMIGNAATEATVFMSRNLDNFNLSDADARKRIARYLSIDAEETDRIINAYRPTLPNPTPTALMIAIVTDFQFRKNTMNIAAMKAEQGSAPVYYYVFDWQTPVLGGVLHSPHTLEVPFVFGTTKAAAALVGDGSELAPLGKTVMDTWVTFARTGNPNHSGLPHWPTYNNAARPAMMLDLHCHVENDPGGTARQALSALPTYEYAVPLNYISA